MTMTGRGGHGPETLTRRRRTCFQTARVVIAWCDISHGLFGVRVERKLILSWSIRRNRRILRHAFDALGVIPDRLTARRRRRASSRKSALAPTRTDIGGQSRRPEKGDDGSDALERCKHCGATRAMCNVSGPVKWNG